MPKVQEEQLSEQEIAQRRDAVIKRMLNTPPEKHKDVPKRRKTEPHKGGSTKEK